MNPLAQTGEALRAGAAATAVDPPLGLVMAAYGRSEGASERLGTLEVTAAAFERAGTRILICGVDTLAIQAPEADVLRARVARATRAEVEAVLLNSSHTHHAPPGCRSTYELFAPDAQTRDAALGYIDWLHEQVVEVARRAVGRLEPASVRWAEGSVASAQLSINRRERCPDGQVREPGWERAGPVDHAVPCLRAVTIDGTPIVTIVGFACHPVATDIARHAYSPDYCGPLRDAVRAWTGGECVFLQGAAGDISPLIASDEEGKEARSMGRRLALEALRALADRPAWSARLVASARPSSIHPGRYRFESVESEPPDLIAVSEQIDLPLLPIPSAVERAQRVKRLEAQLEVEQRRGDDARASAFELAALRRERPAEARGLSRRATVTALRIGDGSIVTGPAEIFSATGSAIRARSRGNVCLYAAYSNGCVGYIPTAEEHFRGGYEVDNAFLAYGLPSPISPAAEALLVDASTRLLDRIYP